MNRAMRIYRMVDRVMAYAKTEANKELAYDQVKEAVKTYCESYPVFYFKTHVGDDHAARQIASNLSGVKIW